MVLVFCDCASFSHEEVTVCWSLGCLISTHGYIVCVCVFCVCDVISVRQYRGTLTVDWRRWWWWVKGLLEVFSWTLLSLNSKKHVLWKSCSSLNVTGMVCYLWSDCSFWPGVLFSLTFVCCAAAEAGQREVPAALRLPVFVWMHEQRWGGGVPHFLDPH